MTKNSLILAACIASQIGFALPVAAQGRSLFAGTATEPGALGALPSRAQRSAAPEITLPLKLEAVRNDSHPALRTTTLVGEDVLRLVGAGFGREAGGREVQIKVGRERITLTVLAWHDDEVRVQVPDLTGLGIDGKQAASFERELAQGKKSVVGPKVEIGIALDSKWVAKRSGQLAVAYRDLDGDGSTTIEDCDDFDPRRRPGNQETYDVAGVDEDCNADTQASPPVAAPLVAPEADPLVAPDSEADPLGIDSPEL